MKDARRSSGPTPWSASRRTASSRPGRPCSTGPTTSAWGRCFPPSTKQFAQVSGRGTLRAVAAEIRLPAFAIGGISRDNLSQVLAAGFTQVAVSSAVTASADPAAAARELLQLLPKSQVGH